MSAADPSGVVIVAHRGCWGPEPENTLASIAKCADLGIPIVEVDVRKTQDEQLVLLHDASLERTTSHSRLLSDVKFQELANFTTLTGEGGPSAEMTSHRIPTFEEVIENLHPTLLLNIDDKEGFNLEMIDIAAENDLAHQIVAKIEARASDPNFVELANYNESVKIVAKITQGEQPLSQIVEEYSEFDVYAFEVKAREEAYFAEGAAAIKSAGAYFWVNTLSQSPEKAAGHVDSVALVDPCGHWGRLIKLGVTAIQTDEPKALQKFLSEPGDCFSTAYPISSK